MWKFTPGFLGIILKRLELRGNQVVDDGGPPERVMGTE